MLIKLFIGIASVFAYLTMSIASTANIEKRLEYMKSRTEYASEKYDMPIPNVLVDSKYKTGAENALGITSCYKYTNGFIYCEILFNPCIFVLEREEVFTEAINHELAHVGSFYEMIRNGTNEEASHGPEWKKAMKKLGYKNPSVLANMNIEEWELCFPRQALEYETITKSKDVFGSSSTE